MAAISYTLLRLGRLVTAMLSLEARLSVLSLVWAGMFLLQRVLVGKRRCSDHWFVQYGAMAGYYRPAPVAFSAASALYYSTSHINESIPLLVIGVQCMFFFTIFASSIRGVAFTNMRSYSLRDRPGDRYSFLRWLVLIVFVQWEWRGRCSDFLVCAAAGISWYALLVMFICTIPVAFGVLFGKPPESTLDCQTKAVADYMMQRKSSKSSSTSPFFDDDANDSLQVDCCRYPFVQGKDGEWVTLKDLVQRDDLPNEDRDIWLSYRFILFGMPMSLLVRNILAIYWRPIHTAFRKLNYYLPIGRLTHIISVVRLFRASPNPNTQYVFDPFQTKAGGAYWRNKIGQYSILQDYDRRRSLKKALVAWFQVIMLSQPSYEFIEHLPVEEEEVDMLELDSMRKLVADTLHSIDGPPTNGTRSLKINKDEINSAWKNRDIADYDWLGTCKQETHTDTILIWHIATCYCDMSLRHSDRPEEGFPRLAKTDTFHKVATALSRYCAYLVTFLPEFLLEHSLTTKQVFQRVLQEAQSALGATPMEEKEKYTKMRELPLPHQHEQQTTFQKGVELGRQLDNLDNTHLRWKVMAEFWAETILYVAPSDNAEAHIAHLAKGGEFITHLWAMLSNAGILKQATGEWHRPASTTKKGPPKKIETTIARTQECPF